VQYLSFILIALLLEASLTGNAQVTGIHGRVIASDSSSCTQALISLLRPDSIVIQSTFTHKDGRFILDKAIPSGNYILSIRHLSFQPQFHKVLLNRQTSTDLGLFVLFPRADSLEAVIVTPRDIRPRLKGDTLEYNTGGVRLNRYANIEALLSRLPGIQVDPDGTITINGQRVERLLVDGEDLFGNSPSIVTRNFNADMIEKVQLLKKKSKQSEFTGIDDGTRTNTLNLVLKESHRHGYSGKAEAGGGDRDYYNANGLIASFANRQQVTLLAMASDIGNIAFNFGNPNGSLMAAPGGNDALGASAGRGIPRVTATGLHYANTWNGNQSHVTGNYQYGHVYTEPVLSTINQQTLPDTIYLQRQQSHSINSQDQHGLNMLFDYLPGVSSAWQFSFGGGDLQSRNQLGSTGSSAFNDALVNSSQRTIRSNVSDRNFQGTVSWRTQGRKRAARIFSVVAGLNGINSNTTGFLYSLNSYYQPGGALTHIDTTDQRKKITDKSTFLNLSANYTDSLGKNAQWGISYTFSTNNSRSDQNTYGRGEGKYDNFIDSLSSHYTNLVTRHQAGLVLMDKIGALRLTLTANLESALYQQNDRLRDTHFRYAYFFFVPRVQSDYAINSFSSLSMTYSGNSTQPSIQLLQPIQNNTDPLHLNLGNPNLRPMFTHSFSGSYQSFRTLQLQIGGSFVINSSDISTRTITDSLGRQVSQPINIKGATSGSLDFSVGHRIKLLDLDARYNSHVSYGHSYNYVNTDLSANDIYNTTAGLSVNKFVPDKFSISLSAGGGYSHSQSSVDAAAAIHYWTANGAVFASCFPMKGLELNSGLGYSWRQKTSAFDANNTTLLWSAFVDKRFWNDKMSLRCSINNILNQNPGITRTNSYNQTSETVINTIGRYWILSATYRFERQAKKQ